MVYYCEIVNCVNHKASPPLNTLFQMSKTLTSKWIQFIKETNSWNNFEPCKSTRLCALHFEEIFMTEAKNGRLVLDFLAYPGKLNQEDADRIFDLKKELKSKLNLDGWFFEDENLIIFDLKGKKIHNMVKFLNKKTVEIRKDEKILTRKIVMKYSEVCFESF